MSWLEDITSSIKYIEGHLTDELTLEKIAAKINLSPFYFQKGFSILCGITVSEYIRNRRLSLAGRDLQTDGVKVIDVAMKFKEWLPGNSDYEIAGMYNIEYYTAHCDYPKGNQDENYYCEIWMPVKSKEQ